jgi:hypothetical protein
MEIAYLTREENAFFPGGWREINPGNFKYNVLKAKMVLLYIALYGLYEGKDTFAGNTT